VIRGTRDDSCWTTKKIKEITQLLRRSNVEYISWLSFTHEPSVLRDTLPLPQQTEEGYSHDSTDRLSHSILVGSPSVASRYVYTRFDTVQVAGGDDIDKVVTLSQAGYELRDDHRPRFLVLKVISVEYNDDPTLPESCN